MPANWSIRTKLWTGLALLLVIVAALFGSATYGLYAYRSLVKDLSTRSTELPLANDLCNSIAEMRVTLSRIRERLTFLNATSSEITTSSSETPPSYLLHDQQFLRIEFHSHFDFVVSAVNRYRKQLEANERRGTGRIADDRLERATLSKIDAIMHRMKTAEMQKDWLVGEVSLEDLNEMATNLQHLAAQLPSHMHERLQALSAEVRTNYRTAIALAWITFISALGMFGVFIWMFRRWFTRPLGILVRGSEKVADGNLDYRIPLMGNNEMSCLAKAMNRMTERFCEIRDDLDRKVAERTKLAIRSEKLASVGFLAAGVAHEINNPLASIAICSESLESRLFEIMSDDPDLQEEREVAQEYVQMIQQEAFRCKNITERLLDFSRLGDSVRQPTDLRQLVEGVIEMVAHIGKYQNKKILLKEGPPVIAGVNSQEVKQVVLNLITNGLESLSSDGTVWIEIRPVEDQVELIFKDDGCGMTEEVQQHLYEPFFTRQRGGKGTGLGLSISYRIVSEHNGMIDATSDGPGKGSQFVVTLPRNIEEIHKEKNHRYQAA